MNAKEIQKNKGFTLLELIVSLGLFIVVITLSTSALLSLTDINRKVQSMRIAFDNLNLAIESISRDIRMGTAYNCDSAIPITLSSSSGGNNCSLGSFPFAFFSQDGKTVVYRKTGATIERSRDKGFPGTFSSITSPNIIIDRLSFQVVGADVSLGNQPRVLILVSGTAGTGETKSSFNIQTLVTQRMPDL